MAIKTEVFKVRPTRDDGTFFIFLPLDPNSPDPNTGQPWASPNYTGFMHRPTETSKPFGNPPAYWSQFTDLGTWVETIKYAYRNNTYVELVYDDAIANLYQSPYGGGFTLQQLYAVTPV